MPLGALTELFGVGNSLPEERERNWVTLKVYGSPFFIGFPALISLRKARTHGAARGKRPRCSDADTLSCIYFVRECEISCQTHIAGGAKVTYSPPDPCLARQSQQHELSPEGGGGVNKPTINSIGTRVGTSICASMQLTSMAMAACL